MSLQFSFIANIAATRISAMIGQSWGMRLLPKYGYLAILVAAFWEGEVVLIAAGALCGRGYLDWRLTILAAAIGGSAGDPEDFFSPPDSAGERVTKIKPPHQMIP